MLSVIIPVLNEAENLQRLLPRLLAETTPCQIIVVDGHSEDGSAEVAREFGVETISSRRGRGQQLVAGVKYAAGDTLLFLHADTALPANALSALVRQLDENPDVIGGNFRLHFDGGDPFAEWLNGFYVWLRERNFYYGDSGIFVRRAVYDRIGGIRPLALMEDYDFVRRMEAFGQTCCIDEPPLVTSSRRFKDRHPVAIVWGWLKIHAYYHLGVSPDYMARIYDSARQRSGRRLHR